jgi:hypothetical protein
MAPFLATTAISASIGSDRHRCGDVRVRIVAFELEVLKTEGKQIVDRGVQVQRRQGTRRAGQLQARLFE